MNLRPAFSAYRQRISEFMLELQEWPWRDTLKTLRTRFAEDRLAMTAGSLTFTTLIALVPLLTVMLAVFTAFPMFSSFQMAVEKYFLQTLVPASIAKPVLGALTQFALKANKLGTAGLIVLFITAIALMLTIDRTLNAIWRVRKPRPIAQRVLVYWAAVTLGPLLLGMSLTATSYAVSSKGLASVLPGGVSPVLSVIVFLLVWGAMSGLFHYVPNTYVRWRDALTGGLFVAIGIELAKRGLALYVTMVPAYSTVYGAFATVPIFLIWIYLGWVIILLGAVVAAYRPSLAMHVVRHGSTPGYRFSLALAVLRELNAARSRGARGLTIMQLAQQLRTDPLQIDPVAETLINLDWVARLDEAGEQRLVLLCNPQATLCSPLVTHMLLEPLPAAQAFWRRASLGEMMLSEAINS